MLFGENTILNINTDIKVQPNSQKSKKKSLFSPSFFKKSGNDQQSGSGFDSFEPDKSDESDYIDDLQDLLNVMHLELGRTKAEIEGKPRNYSNKNGLKKHHHHQFKRPTSPAQSVHSVYSSTSSFHQQPPNNYLCHNCFIPGHYGFGLGKEIFYFHHQGRVA